MAQAHWRLGLVLEKEDRKANAIAEVEIAARPKPDVGEAGKDVKRLR